MELFLFLAFCDDENTQTSEIAVRQDMVVVEHWFYKDLMRGKWQGVAQVRSFFYISFCFFSITNGCFHVLSFLWRRNRLKERNCGWARYGGSLVPKVRSFFSISFCFFSITNGCFHVLSLLWQRNRLNERNCSWARYGGSLALAPDVHSFFTLLFVSFQLLMDVFMIIWYGMLHAGNFCKLDGLCLSWYLWAKTQWKYWCCY